MIFVRKRLPEIQYLRARISADQRSEFDQLVRNAIMRIAAAEFPQHSGIRFPQNQCTRCPLLGLCLGDQEHSQAHFGSQKWSRSWLVGRTCLLEIRRCHPS